MPTPCAVAAHTVGVIANPASGRDMRRLLGWASVSPTSEKVHEVLRLLAAMGSLGVQEAWLPPDDAGIAMRVRESALHAPVGMFMPKVHLLDMPCTGTAGDSREAASRLRGIGVRLIAVLGGDGTHRAVAGACGDIALATLSTGTNNAFPGRHEASLLGLAGALWLKGLVPDAIALRSNKRLRLRGPGIDTLALVDLCLSSQESVGARALWRAADLRELFVCFAEPTAIGLSAIAGLACPVARDDPAGLHVRFGPGRVLAVPLLPGGMAAVSIAGLRRLEPGVPLRLPALRGTVALDGEREFEISEHDTLELELDAGGPRTLDVDAVLGHAARQGLMFSDAGPMPLSA
jgi:predicted polyphosphate/ATP-dependent NAD kinase